MTQIFKDYGNGIKLKRFNTNVGEKDLLDNIGFVWKSLGRQPVFRDMKNEMSKYSTHQYLAKYGTWMNALEKFISYSYRSVPCENKKINLPLIKHATNRQPSERLKVRVLIRDGNRCRLCGIVVTGEEIHFDHIIPWSKGGETIFENLQILCERHNLAKGDLCANEEKNLVAGYNHFE